MAKKVTKNVNPVENSPCARHVQKTFKKRSFFTFSGRSLKVKTATPKNVFFERFLDVQNKP